MMKSPIRRVVYTSDGRFLLCSAANDGRVRIIDPSRGNNSVLGVELDAAEHQGGGQLSSVNALAISARDLVITGSEDCRVRLFTGLSQRLASATLIGTNSPIRIAPDCRLDAHESPVTACSISSQAKSAMDPNTWSDNEQVERFATASKDAHIIVWSYANLTGAVPNQVLSLQNAHADWITDLRWSSSSEFLLTASSDQTLKVGCLFFALFILLCMLL